MRLVCAGVVLGIAGSMGLAEEQDSRARRVAELESRLAALESQQEQAAADVAATVDSVLRDAERRSALLATSGDASAGYDNGFFVRSGDFLLHPSILSVFRYVANWTDGQGTEDGFTYRRVEFQLDGTAFTKRLSYQFTWKTKPDGNPPLEYAFAHYQFEDSQWAIRGGQYKDDVYHEETTSSGRQLAAERSLANAALMGGCFDRVQGVAIHYGDGANPLHAQLSFHDGAGSFNTDFTDEPSKTATKSNFGVTGRAEWKVCGDWKDYRDFTARDTKSDLLVLGLGADWTQGEYSDGVSSDIGGDRIFAAADVQWELPQPRLGMFAALLADYTSFNDSTVADERLNWGGLVQVGWAIDRQWEPFARYDFIVMDDEFLASGARDTFHEITVGVNYYLGPSGAWGHRAKITLDLSYLPSGSPISSTSVGIPAASDDPMLFVRAQFQLII